MNSKLWVDPNPFSPDGDSIDDVTNIYFNLPVESCRITLDIYNTYGNRVRRVVSNLAANNSYPKIHWDGADDNNRIQPVGRYIILLEALDLAKGKVYRERCTVVLAR